MSEPIAKPGNFVRYRTDTRWDPTVFQVLEVNHPWYLLRNLRSEEWTVTVDKIVYWSEGWFPHAIDNGLKLARR